eukprot:2250472-Pleurochrysis_carterae.AAC.2
MFRRTSEPFLSTGGTSWQGAEVQPRPSSTFSVSPNPQRPVHSSSLSPVQQTPQSSSMPLSLQSSSPSTAAEARHAADLLASPSDGSMPLTTPQNYRKRRICRNQSLGAVSDQSHSNSTASSLYSGMHDSASSLAGGNLAVNHMAIMTAMAEQDMYAEFSESAESQDVSDPSTQQRRASHTSRQATRALGGSSESHSSRQPLHDVGVAQRASGFASLSGRPAVVPEHQRAVARTWLMQGVDYGNGIG